MSKVIFLSGSPKEDGNTMQVFKEMSKTIEANGVETEIISLAGMNIRECMDFTSGAEDNFDEIIEKIKDAEGLIVGGPVYWGSVRTTLTTALHRLGLASMSNGNFLSRKVGGAVVVGRRGGHTSAFSELQMFFLSNDMFVAGSTYWNIVFGQNPGDALKDEEGMQTVTRFAENTAFLINKIY